VTAPSGARADAGSAATPRGTGAIHDIGYRRYPGERLGRAYAARSLFVDGVRTVFAVGRTGRARLAPLLLGGAAIVPAAVQAAASAYVGDVANLVTYSNYTVSLSFIFALFCASQAPELVSSDLRTRTLVLYLSRALHRADYVAARVLALVAAVFVLTVAPLLVLLAGRVFASRTPWSAFTAEAPALLPIVAFSLVAALLMGSVSVAIASLTTRRSLASAAVLGFFIVTAGVTQGLRDAFEGGAWDRLVLLNPFLVLGGVANWLFDAEPRYFESLRGVDLPGWTFGAAALALIALAAAVLGVRYGRIDA